MERQRSGRVDQPFGVDSALSFPVPKSDPRQRLRKIESGELEEGVHGEFLI